MPDRIKSPSYNDTVIRVLGRISTTGSIDQPKLRQLTLLAPSYLVLDSTTFPTTADGVAEWGSGMNRICDGKTKDSKAAQKELLTSWP